MTHHTTTIMSIGRRGIPYPLSTSYWPTRAEAEAEAKQWTNQDPFVFATITVADRLVATAIDGNIYRHGAATP